MDLFISFFNNNKIRMKEASGLMKNEEYFEIQKLIKIFHFGRFDDK